MRVAQRPCRVPKRREHEPTKASGPPRARAIRSSGSRTSARVPSRHDFLKVSSSLPSPVGDSPGSSLRRSSRSSATGGLLESGPVLSDRSVQRRVLRSMAEAAAVRKGESVCGVAHAPLWSASGVPRPCGVKTARSRSQTASRGAGARCDAQSRDLAERRPRDRKRDFVNDYGAVDARASGGLGGSSHGKGDSARWHVNHCRRMATD